MTRRLLLLMCLALAPLPARADLEMLLQMVDYMGVDYPAAVADGVVIHAGEYAEMREFAARIAEESAALPPGPGRDEAMALAAQLGEAVVTKAGAERIAALTRALRGVLMSGFDVALVPRHRPDRARAKQLYAEQCAGCHGAAGDGDGPLGAGMDPAPIAFTDAERARQRSLYGLFNTITLGVPGTSMGPYDALSPSERWALAFYVGSLWGEKPDDARAYPAWRRSPLSLREAVTLSPAELDAARAGGAELALWLRHAPDVLFASQAETIDFALRALAESLAAYRAGETGRAEDLAVSAYLEGFELSEAPLRNAAPELMLKTEQAMMALRQALRAGAPAADVEARYRDVVPLLEQSRETLATRTMTAGLAFTSSFVILLREGLEAILVIAAMVAFLVRSRRHDALRWVHGGWILALAAGALTWLASVSFIEISGATREMTEGVATLLAAAILFYVGFWMHRNSSAAQWNAYLREQMQTALSARTLWTVAVISFLAVYREVFETILFYQALWVQVEREAHQAVFGGAAVAVVVLVAVMVAVERFGVRLPLRRFFLASAMLMITLAVIFAGKGIMALQEAGLVAMHPLPLPRLEWIGFYPNAQVLAAQLVLLAGAAGLFARERRAR
jgi:high-affinity iron transporter